MNLLQPAIRKTTLFLELIKFSHTVFALPFAFMGAILAARGIPTPPTVFWIVVAMVGARSGAMAINRLADQEFDARNPRTQERALPKGLVKRGEVIVFMLGSFALFLFAASRLNPLCLKLAPLAMAVLILYSYTKRFTFLSHLMLGWRSPSRPWCMDCCDRGNGGGSGRTRPRRPLLGSRVRYPVRHGRH